MAPTQRAAEASIYQVRVTLQELEPLLWRRFLVRSDVTLAKLHHVLQVVMGWTDSHLHQFIVGERAYGVPDPDYGDDMVMHDERRPRLSQVAPGQGAEFHYEYDFGDSWQHHLVVERVLPPDPGLRHARCLAGERACPPEDVGGVWGYAEFLEALHDPSHPEHDEYLEWIGGEFDPEAFDVDEVNEILSSLR